MIANYSNYYSTKHLLPIQTLHWDLYTRKSNLLWSLGMFEKLVSNLLVFARLREVLVCYKADPYQLGEQRGINLSHLEQ